MAANHIGKTNILKTKITLTLAVGLLLGALFFSIITLPVGTISGQPGPSKATPTPTNTVSPTPTVSLTPTPTPTSTPTPTPTPTPVEPFVRNEDEKIVDVIRGYCTAKLPDKINNIENFRPYVNNIENVKQNKSYYERQYQLAESADNFEIYTISGKYGLEYIAFVVYDLKIKSIEVTSLEATLLQLVRTEPDENGETRLVVNTELLTDEQREYQNEVQTHQDFYELYLNFWQRDFEKVQQNESYAKVWYNLFVSGVNGFTEKFASFEDFVTYMRDEATLQDFLELKSSMHGDSAVDDEPDNTDDNETEGGEGTDSGSGQTAHNTGNGAGSGGTTE
jgi:hypothetical protein